MSNNQNTLYISDLDGTLLDTKGRVSNYSKEQLNKLIDEGVNFSIATARTPATVVDLLEGVNINLPVVVMNGASIYDIKNNKYLDINYIKETAVERMLAILAGEGQNAFIYCIQEDHIYTYYSNLENKAQEVFYKERENNSRKTFMRGEKPNNMPVVYFVLIDTESTIRAFHEKIKDIDGIKGIAYKDVYLEDTYYLEIYHEEVSKAHAIKKIKGVCGFDKVVCFGDNLNDIPMFKISNECYAVENAKKELKQMATGVIGSNDEDGVAKFISKKI